MTTPRDPKFKPATEAEIEDAAKVTPTDIERAKVAWRRDASPEFADLLDAEPVDDEGD